MKQGMNSSDIRRKNRGLFLKHIAMCEANSRVELAKITGLAKMTAGNIVQELIEKGLVEEAESLPNDSTGPNPQRLTINSFAPKIIGIYLSRDGLTVSVGNLSSEIVFSKRTLFKNENAQSIEAKILRGVKSALEFEGKVLAIGVAAIGPIDKNGAISASTNFFGIKSLPIKQILEENFGLPVVVYNDTNASAVAEQFRGRGKYKSFCYIGISNGIGAGIINDGNLLMSNDSFLGEIGHTTIDYKGKACPCGNRGCLELYANMPVILSQLEKAVERKISEKDIESIHQNTPADLVLSQVANKLAVSFINLVNLLKPEAIIIGHEGFFLPHKYLKQIEKKINSTMFRSISQGVVVEKAGFGEKSAVYGSICCVLREIFEGRLLFE